MKQSINNKGQVELAFTGKLVSPLSEQWFENKNGKKYKLASIEAVIGGQKRTLTTMIPAGNVQYGLTVGNSYASKAIFVNGVDKDPIIVTSHLSAGSRATADMFAGEFDSSEVPQNELAKK